MKTAVKIALLLCTLCALAGLAVAQGQGQGKPKIALYVASAGGLTADEQSVLTTKFLAPFTASGMYSVIDRSDEFTKKVTAERKKQMGGDVDDKQIYKIGIEYGAKYVCIVALVKAFGKYNVSARLVDVETAEIYLAQGETDIVVDLAKADISGAALAVFNQIHGRGAAGGSGQAVAPTPPVQSSVPVSSSGGGMSSGNSFTDSRDGKTYRTVVIGGKRWMAENLNYQTGNSKCYDNNSSNCSKYGRLYDWNTARSACPSGWRLPTDNDWNNLVQTVGGSSIAGGKLKSKSGWKDNGNGTDDYGFSALPGGYGYGGSIDYVGSYGYWWSATEVVADVAWVRGMNFDHGNVVRVSIGKTDLFSARCLQE